MITLENSERTEQAAHNLKIQIRETEWCAIGLNDMLSRWSGLSPFDKHVCFMMQVELLRMWNRAVELRHEFEAAREIDQRATLEAVPFPAELGV